MTVKTLIEKLDMMSLDIIEAEKYLGDTNFYFDFVFEIVGEPFSLKWDSREKRLWVLKNPNSCRLCECSVNIRTVLYNQLPEFLDAIHEKAKKLLEECKIDHTHQRLAFKFKELKGVNL